MRLIEPSFEIWEQDKPWKVSKDEDGKTVYVASEENLKDDPTKEELMSLVSKQIERVGRVCYKSEDKMTDDSAVNFVGKMIQSKHYAMLEHGTVYLKMPAQGIIVEASSHNYKDYEKDKYSKCRGILELDENGKDMLVWCYVTTNLRVIEEHNWWDDLKYMCLPTKYHERRVTVHFVCNRQVSHEFVRHRVFSFAQESTRFCNYSKDKFGRELTFIKPCWQTTEIKYDTEYGDEYIDLFEDELHNIEDTYFRLLRKGWSPQQAAQVLPNALKTELCMTGFVSDWDHFFDLRSSRAKTGQPHPQAKQLADPLLEEFKKRELL